LDRATARLRREWETAGKAQAFDQLQPYLAGDHQAPPQTEVAAQLGLSEGALRVAVHRMRRRYRELVRDEIAPTVAAEDEIEDEIRHLMIALRSGI
jgi:RNA polymerase sigma-70 factor (ECF subfamily)